MKKTDMCTISYQHVYILSIYVKQILFGFIKVHVVPQIVFQKYTPITGEQYAIS